MVSHINSQGEKIEIFRVEKGEFKGQNVLIMHDDEDVSNTRAIMLLDESTVNWLLEHLTKRGIKV